jgi:hypothetical protein
MTANVTGSFGKDAIVIEGESLSLRFERDHRELIGRKRDM